jgi:GNAT superfamily N-acetyltransferase
MIKYEHSKPTLSEYKGLFESTGWTSSISVSDEILQTAIDNSWYWISAYDDQTLIGIGRLVSDGALYAFVCDMIVHPKYQKQGIGTSILEMLKEKCMKHSFQRVWLFAAPGRAGFYLDNGFEIRPDNAPGMQMKKNW